MASTNIPTRPRSDEPDPILMDDLEVADILAPRERCSIPRICDDQGYYCNAIPEPPQMDPWRSGSA
jgi:hypothetical protein